MEDAVNSISTRNVEHRIIFLKSWNEWAEGNHVEPDTQWGLQYLQALKGVLE